MCANDIGTAVLHPLEFGISCVYTDEDSAGIELATYDIDGDQYGHFADALPHDSTQNYDTDTDGFGDSTLGNKPDACLFEAGNSTLDRYGCLDTDGDGQSNLNDGFPIDPTQVSDSDFDGYGDNTSGFQGDDCPSVYGLSLIHISEPTRPY